MKNVSAFNLPVETPELLSYLINLDLIVCGTDDTTSRAYLNQLCHQFYLPVLDLGVQFGANPNTGKIVKEVGRANLMLPGTPCMCCTGQINPQQLTIEGLSDIEQQRRAEEGYITGMDVSEPSMMLFNMQVAAKGLQRFMEWVTGFRSIDCTVYDIFRFFGLGGTEGIKSMKKRSDEQCLFCGPNARLLGVGKSSPMLTLPRYRQKIS